MGASNPNKYYIPFQVQEDVMTISSALSIGIATICVIINLIMRRWYPQACNRVSFRLAALISFMDVGSAAAWLSTWYHRHDPSGDSDYICVLEMFSIVITNLGSAFATGAIAMNLFVLFVLGWDGRRTIEQMYFLAIGVCSAGIAMVS
ncbi:hypothetical protein DFS34DRAFT_232483 [Phlyctochytrium arcticum]|nr:hypothetical protein DFS34DRAFT_232483 [Phlyctochytrium arcticum]